MAQAETIGSHGVSESWLNQKANVVRIFDLFRNGNVTYGQVAPVPLVQLSDVQARNRTLWESLATYLVREYKIDRGEHRGKPLKFTNVLNYLRSAMRTVEKNLQANASAALREFFSCLDQNSTSSDAVWWRGVKKNILRETFEQYKNSGEPIDGSEVPIYLEHIEALIRAYSKEGSSMAAGARPLDPACLTPAPLIPATTVCVQRPSSR